MIDNLWFSARTYKLSDSDYLQNILRSGAIKMFDLFARVSRRCAKGLFQNVNSPRGSANCLGLKKRSVQLGSPGFLPRYPKAFRMNTV